jgi:hypothetical protein
MSKQLQPTSLFMIVGLLLIALAKFAYDKGTEGANG